MLQPPDTAPWIGGAVLCLVGWVALDHGKLEERARRYRNAAYALYGAIVRYEVSSDLPESTLVEAERRAREKARVERIRTAPAWIRSERRRYWLRILGWVSPAALVLALEIPAANSWWRWLRPWHVLAASLVLLAGGWFQARKLGQASGILGEAMERYEYESAATERELEEAGRWASETASGKGGGGQPAE